MRFSNLLTVNAVNKALTFIKQDYFKDLAKLEYLSLNQNVIVEIEKGAFSGLKQLTNLYLHNNNLSKIEKETFKGLVSLRKLHLHDNSIASIHPEAFSTNSRLSYVSISNNPVNAKNILPIINLIPASASKQQAILDEGLVNIFFLTEPCIRECSKFNRSLAECILAECFPDISNTVGKQSQELLSSSKLIELQKTEIESLTKRSVYVTCLVGSSWSLSGLFSVQQDFIWIIS